MAAEATDRPGPRVASTTLAFGLDDPDRRLAAVRLRPAAVLGPEPLEFDREGGRWVLRLPRPAVRRLEYKLEVAYPDGGHEEICDPANPVRAPGAFGDKSVVEFPGYAAPGWLTRPAAAGSWATLLIPAPELDGAVAARIWSPPGARNGAPLPLLVAHDGPEYAALSALDTFVAAGVAAGTLPALRLALLGPGHRDEWYSANPAYADTLARVVLPMLRATYAVARPVVGMGASLGGLAMLHAQRSHPEAFDALFCQSASFLDRTLDPQERRFVRFERVTAFVDAVLRDDPPAARPVPVTLTCGTAEENLANNRQAAAALAAAGYPVTFAELPDAHNFVAWRDGFDPYLTDLLRPG